MWKRAVKESECSWKKNYRSSGYSDKYKIKTKVKVKGLPISVVVMRKVLCGKLTLPVEGCWEVVKKMILRYTIK